MLAPAVARDPRLRSADRAQLPARSTVGTTATSTGVDRGAVSVDVIPELPWDFRVLEQLSPVILGEGIDAKIRAAQVLRAGRSAAPPRTSHNS